MQVFNPTGAASVTTPFAPRLKTLHGKKVALLSNGIWQAHRMLPLLQQQLGQEYPLSKFEVILAGNDIQNEQTVNGIVSEEYDAVIVGNAA